MSEQDSAANRAPSTEEEILAARVGETVPLNGPVLIADYDPAWPALFNREAQRIHSVLGDRVIMLEHVGSTSVPGLAAKPRIDPCLPDLGDSEYSRGQGLQKLHTRGVRYIVTCTSSLIRDTYEDDENIESMPPTEVKPIAEFHAIYSDIGRNYSEDMYVGMDTVRVYAVR